MKKSIILSITLLVGVFFNSYSSSIEESIADCKQKCEQLGSAQAVGNCKSACLLNALSSLSS